MFNVCQRLENLMQFLFIFQVYSKDGETPVGQIRKQWSGIIKEYFTDTDNFGITFPMDLDVNVKATLIGACFLIVSNRTLYKICFATKFATKEWVKLHFCQPTS